MRTRGAKRFLTAPALASVSLALGACAAIDAGRSVPVTPQRPTFSTDASTTASGTLEVEAGLLLDPGDRLDTPTTLKHGLDERSEAFVGFSPLLRIDDPDGSGHATGVGDLLLGYRRRIRDAIDAGPAVAVQVAVKVPTADDDRGLGSGEVDGFASAAAVWTREAWTLTGFGQLGLLGEPGDGGADVQTLASFTAGRSLASDLSAFGELAGLWTPEQDDEQVFLTLGVARAVSPGQVFDAGFVVGLTDDAPDFAFVVGWTQNLGRAPWTP